MSNALNKRQRARSMAASTEAVEAEVSFSGYGEARPNGKAPMTSDQDSVGSADVGEATAVKPASRKKMTAGRAKAMLDRPLARHSSVLAAGEGGVQWYRNQQSAQRAKRAANPPAAPGDLGGDYWGEPSSRPRRGDPKKKIDYSAETVTPTAPTDSQRKVLRAHGSSERDALELSD